MGSVVGGTLRGDTAFPEPRSQGRSQQVSRSSRSGRRAGDALGPEHRDVAAVVLEGEAQVEAEPRSSQTVDCLKSRASS